MGTRAAVQWKSVSPSEDEMETAMLKCVEESSIATALVLSKDSTAVNLLLGSLKPFAIRLRICAEAGSAIGLLSRNKFEAIIADLDLGEQALRVLKEARLSPANRTAISFLITSEAAYVRMPSTASSTFVLTRPLTRESISHTVRAAYGLLVRERRRYFRCAITVPAFVQGENTGELSCVTANISEGGVAINFANPRDQAFGEIRFSLPGDDGQFFAQTKTSWRDETGHMGLEFISLPRKSELQEWLARKLEESLPESAAQLFRREGKTKTGAL